MENNLVSSELENLRQKRLGTNGREIRNYRTLSVVTPGSGTSSQRFGRPWRKNRKRGCDISPCSPLKILVRWLKGGQIGKKSP
jgi:hypothetical protein